MQVHVVVKMDKIKILVTKKPMEFYHNTFVKIYV